MEPFIALFFLFGISFGIYKVYRAWQVKAGIPIGLILGGVIGHCLLGDTKTNKPRPNIGGLVFWGFVLFTWIGFLFIGLIYG